MFFSIGIPTINRADMLNKALAIYAVNMPDVEIFICDNGRQKDIVAYPNVTILPQHKNLGVAGSWNLLIKTIHKTKPFAYILSDDVICQSTADEINEFLQNRELDFLSGAGFQSFAISRFVFNRVGCFDEKFYPAYYEDNDYHYRLKLAGIPYYYGQKALRIEQLGRSSSIAKDPSLIKNSTCEKYYLEKWGGPRNSEKFTSPFNK